MSVLAGNARHRAHPHEGSDIILPLKEFPNCFGDCRGENSSADQKEEHTEYKRAERCLSPVHINVFDEKSTEDYHEKSETGEDSK